MHLLKTSHSISVPAIYDHHIIPTSDVHLSVIVVFHSYKLGSFMSTYFIHLTNDNQHTAVYGMKHGN